MSNITKNFNLTVIKEKFFDDIIIEGFAFIDSLFINIDVKLQLDFIMTAISEKSLDLNLANVELGFIFEFIESLTVSLGLSNLDFAFSFFETLNASGNIDIKLQNGFLPTETLKASAPFVNPTVDMQADATLGQFNALGEFDPDTLGTLDILTLGEMDFT